MKFSTTVRLANKTATGLPVPPEVVDSLGAGKKPAVLVTVGGHTYRGRIATMGGEFLISLSAENRALAGVAAGDEVEVELSLDDVPREVVVPPYLADSFDAATKSAFEALSYSNQRRHVLAVEGAKTAPTRARRIDAVIAELRGER